MHDEIYEDKIFDDIDDKIDADLEEEYRESLKALSPDEQEALVKLQTLGRIYEQADRVITGDPIVVHIEENGPAPAWSDGKSISFNASEIKEYDFESLTQLDGLNYHELCHHEYTPRKSSLIVSTVLERNQMRSFNILEDQRIETLMSGRFPSVVPYLKATIARWLMDTPQAIATNYVCIRGRRYLDPAITEAFRDQFIDQSLLKPIARIVDEYRKLTFPQNQERGIELVDEFQKEVLDKLPFPIQTQPGGGCIDRNPTPSGKPAKGVVQMKDMLKATKNERDGDPIDSPTNEVDDDGAEPATNNSVTIDGTAQEAIDLRDKAFSLKPNRKQGVGHQPSVGGIPKDLEVKLKRSIEDALSSKQVTLEIKAKQRILNGGDGQHTHNLKDGKFDDTAVPADLFPIVRRFQRELQILRDNAEPGWEYETPSGKLNVSRVMRGCEIDEAFDRWYDGNDSTDMEIVIAVDRSGSMGYNKNDLLASQACWVIKRAAEAIDIPVTVYAFDDKSELAYHRTAKVLKDKFKFIFGNGGTNPTESIIDAERLLISSKAKSKVFMLITDGAFRSKQSDEAIVRMAKRGVLTSMVLITEENNSYTEWHNTEVQAKVDSAAMLIPFAQKLVIGAIKKRAQAQ